MNKNEEQYQKIVDMCVEIYARDIKCYDFYIEDYVDISADKVKGIADYLLKVLNVEKHDIQDKIDKRVEEFNKLYQDFLKTIGHVK
jgi:undecaprenyl pyrophosphate synthase